MADLTTARYPVLVPGRGAAYAALMRDIGWPTSL